MSSGNQELGPAFEMVGGAIAGSGEAAELSADAHEARGKAIEQSLGALKRKIAGDMSKLERPVLVVVDDIDRLTSDEVREVFQLVKANADFPNLIYLLMFDREIVSGALDTISGGRGRDFLDKIVQVLFHVPQPPLSNVHQVLFDGLNAYLKHPSVAERWNRHAWGQVWNDGLARYFTNLRSVYRFLGSFGFHVSQMRRGQTFELNPLDLIVLETLRLFESKLYEAIPTHQGLLIGSDLGLFARPEDKANERAEELNRLLSDTVPEPRRARARQILETLFPALSSHRRSGDEALLRGLHVAHEKIFSRYFTLSLAEDDISQADLNSLLGALAEPSAFTRVCASLKKRKLLELAFQRLDAYKESLSVKLFPGVVTALSEVGDTLPYRDRVGFFDFEPLAHAWRLIYFGLRQISDETQRFEFLRAGVAAT